MSVMAEESRDVCDEFRRAVRQISDRVVAIDPDFPPDDESWGTARLREAVASDYLGLLHARHVDDELGASVEVFFDSHHPLARGLPSVDDATGVRSLRVAPSSLRRATLVAADLLPTDRVVAIGEDRFDLAVTLRGGPDVNRLLPESYLSGYSARTWTTHSLRASVRRVAPGICEVKLLLGERGGCEQVVLPQQYRVAPDEQGSAFVWPIYVNYDGTLPEASRTVEVGRVYAAHGLRPALVTGPATPAGRHPVVYLDTGPGEETRTGELPAATLHALNDDLVPLADRAARAAPLAAALVGYRERIVNEAGLVRSLRAELEASRQETAQAVQRHTDDIEAISERFIAEAEERSWCNEYDGVITDLNRSLNIPMNDRTRSFDVRVRVTYYVDVQVEARDRDHASELIENDGDLAVNEVNEDDPDSITVVEVSRS